MPQIHIDEDIYEFLCRSTQTIGESASSILRRLLGVASTKTPSPLSDGPSQEEISTTTDRVSDEVTAKAERQNTDDPVEDFLSSYAFRICETGVERFLAILAWLYQRDPDSFRKVRSVCGTERLYFSESTEELHKHGNAVNPQRIPNTSWWVVTNNDKPRKKAIIREVTKILGYRIGDVVKLSQAIDPNTLFDKDALV
jgi:negative modulator of initiation of replication